MPSRSFTAVLAALCCMPLMASPAAAQAADGWAEALIQKRLVHPGDRVWLAPQELQWSAVDLQALDDLTAALVARRVPVVRDLSFPPEAGDGDLRKPLAMLKELGVTKVVSYTRARDEDSAAFRILEVPTGQVLAVETLTARAHLQPEKPSIAETPGRPANYSTALGLSVSYLAGSGLTYRRWFENDWGVQVAGIPFVTVSNNVPSGFVNLGLQGMVPFFKGERVRLYGLLGTGAAYNVSNTYAYPAPALDGTQPPAVMVSSDRWDLGVAPGVGVDYLFYNNFALTAALGYTVSRTSGRDVTPSWSLGPGGTFGVLVYW